MPPATLFRFGMCRAINTLSNNAAADAERFDGCCQQLKININKQLSNSKNQNYIQQT